MAGPNLRYSSRVAPCPRPARPTSPGGSMALVPAALAPHRRLGCRGWIVTAHQLAGSMARNGCYVNLQEACHRPPARFLLCPPQDPCHSDGWVSGARLPQSVGRFGCSTAEPRANVRPVEPQPVRRPHEQQHQHRDEHPPPPLRHRPAHSPAPSLCKGDRAAPCRVRSTSKVEAALPSPSSVPPLNVLSHRSLHSFLGTLAGRRVDPFDISMLLCRTPRCPHS